MGVSLPLDLEGRVDRRPWCCNA